MGEIGRLRCWVLLGASDGFETWLLSSVQGRCKGSKGVEGDNGVWDEMVWTYRISGYRAMSWNQKLVFNLSFYKLPMLAWAIRQLMTET